MNNQIDSTSHLLPGETQEEFERKKNLFIASQKTPRELIEEKERKLQAISKDLDEILNWQNVAKQILDIHPIFYDKTGLFWSWEHDRKCYSITDETDILNIVDKAVKKNTLKGGIRSQIIEAFKREGRLRTPKDPPKTWLQFKDKIYDVENKIELEPTPDYFLTNPVPHNLGASNQTPLIDALLHQWGGEEYQLTLKQILAYCVLRDYPIHRIFLFIGSGSNGKGSYLRLLNTFIGTENVASMEMDLLIHNQFHVTKLHKKLCCQMSETNFGQLKNTSMLKKLSGGDLIGFEYKNKGPFDDYNYAKIIIASNSLPATHDKTDGFYRRWVIIDFNKQFPEETDPVSHIPEIEYENLCRWCSESMADITRQRKFHNEGTIQDRKERYESRSNPLRIFVEQNYHKDVNGLTPANDFYDEFSRYLHDHGLRGLTYQVVRSMMKDEGYEYEKHRIPLFENPVMCIVGLKRMLSEHSVPGVPVVPPTLGYSREQYPGTGIAGTAGTAGTERSYNIDRVRDFIRKNPKCNAWMLEQVVGVDRLRFFVSKGDLFMVDDETYCF